MSEFKDHLSTTSDQGQRLKVYPVPARGFWNRWRKLVQAVLLLVFLGLPFLTIGGAPALRLDVSHRRFFILGKMFSAQDAPNVIFILGAFLFSMALLTALAGRAWCGWACPQTVFIEAVFRRIEFWIEGDALAQKKLDQGPASFSKAFKKSFKWIVFALVSLVITHSFLAYFVGGSEIFNMVMGSPLRHPAAFTVVMVSTAIVLFDFGWFREQFCLIACPYGRFQSVMMDEHSVTVAYDVARGEPRRPGRDRAGAGDCIDCRKCVAVCPTGIDIRNGWQFECVACTACIDACDSVMEKVQKPKGLIAYRSEAMDRGQPVRWMRARVWVYGVGLALFTAGFGYRWASHEAFHTEALRAKESPYQLLQDAAGAARVLNHFNLKASNQSPDRSAFEVRLSEADREKGIELVQPGGAATVESGETLARPVFLNFPRSLLRFGKAEARIEVLWQAPGAEPFVEERTVSLVGPLDAR